MQGQDCCGGSPVLMPARGFRVSKAFAAFVLIFLISLIALACASELDSTSAPATPTQSVVPTATPTSEVGATATPELTATLVPATAPTATSTPTAALTATPIPTATPEPTSTPRPSPTPKPTATKIPERQATLERNARIWGNAYANHDWVTVHSTHSDEFKSKCPASEFSEFTSFFNTHSFPSIPQGATYVLDGVRIEGDYGWVNSHFEFNGQQIFHDEDQYTADEPPEQVWKEGKWELI